MFNLAQHYHNHNEEDNAIKYYLMAIEHDDSDAMNSLAQIYYQQHQFDMAMQYWMKATEHNNYKETYSVVALCKHPLWIHHGVIYCNKLLNSQFVAIIEQYIVDAVNVLNADMINIIINIAQPTNYVPLFIKFKKLV